MSDQIQKQEKQKSRRGKKAKKGLPPRPLTEEEKAEVNKNFKTLAKMFHPDLEGGCDEVMKLLGNARDKLMNPEAYGLTSSVEPPHIGIVLDDSGSMRKIQFEVIETYNQFLRQQKDHENQATFSLTSFSRIGSIINLRDAEELTSETYQCDQGTPLYQTIAKVIHRIEAEEKQNVVIVIFTDGRESHSRGRYRNPEILKALIKQKLEEGWQFILCTSADILTGTEIGILKKCVTDFTNFSQIMQEVGKKLLQFRSGEVKQISFEGGS